MRAAQWQRVIDVSVNGFFNVTQPLVMPMMRTRWGRIVNVSSVAALTGNRGQVNYAAAKGALNSATKRSRSNWRAAASPSTPLRRASSPPAWPTAAFDDATIARLVPMKRAGTPEEVAAWSDYLVSDEAAYISGQIISVNGGMI